MQGLILLFNLLLCSSILLLLTGVEVVNCSSHHGPKKLFVFGDSYADTGNRNHSSISAWKQPYGVTYPGKPSGRYSDGLVFTDFLAMGLGLKSPMPYTLARRLDKLRYGKLKNGLNLAYGGTGVFDTPLAPYPNMTTQLDIFQGLISQGVFTPSDLQHSVAHVSLIGNDYSNYLLTGGTVQGLPIFIVQVIEQLTLNLQRIINMGITRITVTGLPPLGCLPGVTVTTEYQQCNSTGNQGSQLHNLVLQQAISKLENPNVIFIDFYNAFSSIIQPTGAPQRNLKFNNLLRPCCDGVNSTYSCGDVHANGNKMYTLCKNPKSYFFWDIGHPTQAGWIALTNTLKPTILQVKNGF